MQLASHTCCSPAGVSTSSSCQPQSAGLNSSTVQMAEQQHLSAALVSRVQQSTGLLLVHSQCDDVIFVCHTEGFCTRLHDTVTAAVR
jgi:hypothetical protein